MYVHYSHLKRLLVNIGRTHKISAADIPLSSFHKWEWKRYLYPIFFKFCFVFQRYLVRWLFFPWRQTRNSMWISLILTRFFLNVNSQWKFFTCLSAYGSKLLLFISSQETPCMSNKYPQCAAQKEMIHDG